MAQAAGDPGGSFSAAWRGLTDNPLPRLWALGDSRRAGRGGGWLASPLFWGVALISAFVTLLLIFNLQDFLGWRESVIATRGFCLARIGYALALIALGGMLSAALWLLSRVHALATLALGLLSGDRANPAALDSLLTMRPLSGREIAAALAFHALRLLAPPLAWLNICELGACALLIACAGQFHSTPGEAWLKLLAIAGACLGNFLLGLASGVCLAFYLLIAGRGLRSPVAAETGAALAVLASGMSLLLGPAAVLRTLALVSVQSGCAIAWFICLGLAAVTGYLLILALEWRPARLALLALLLLSLLALLPVIQWHAAAVRRYMPGMRFGGATLNLSESAILAAAFPLAVAPLHQGTPLFFTIYETVPYWANDSPLDRFERFFGTDIKVVPQLAQAAGLSFLVLGGRLLMAWGLAALALLALASWRRELGAAGDGAGLMAGTRSAMSPRGSPRAGRIAWICLALPPPSVLLVLAVFALAHQPRPVNTGDGLLDAWLGLLLKRGAIVHQYGNYSHQLPVGLALSAGDWASLQERFGSDPRYFMLRYHESRWTEPQYRSEGAAIELPGGVRYLEEARRLGLADAGILLALLKEYETAWNKQLCAELAPRHRRPAQDEEKLAFARQVAAELERRYGRQEAELESELLRFGGGQAEVHGFLALLAYERADAGGALAEIRRANSASRNDALTGFPGTIFTHTLSSGRYLADDPWLTGALYQEWTSYQGREGYSYILGENYSSTYLTMSDRLAYTAARKDDPAVLGELVRFDSRHAAAQGNSALAVRISLAAAENVARAVTAAYFGDLNAGQQQALSRLQAKLMLPVISGSYRKSPGSTAAISMQPPQERLMLWLRLIATFGASEYLELTPADGKLARDEQQAFAGEIQQVAAEAERFDYSALVRAR